MPRQRVNIEGEIYFITTKTFRNKGVFNSDKSCKLFLEVLEFCRKKLKFQLYAFAILPNHVHLLILPNNKNTISDVIKHIKGRFAKLYNNIAEDKFLCSRKMIVHSENIISSADEEFILADKTNIDNKPRQRIRVNPVWQRSFYDKAVRSDKELYNVIDYINNNAIKHKLIDNPQGYPYSSWHNYENNGKKLINIDKL